MHRLEHRIPPPIVGIVAGVIAWLCAHFGPEVGLSSRVGMMAAVVVSVAGLVIGLSGVRSFRRVGTTLSPLKPADASSLVEIGIYRHTRNPMYLGLVLMLLAWAFALASPMALVGPVLFVIWMTRFQIIPEERVLSRLFGSQYVAYCARVRRWI